MTRIWYQSSIEFDRAPEYHQALSAHFTRVADAGTVVDLAGVPAGTWGGHQPSHLFGYPYAFQTLLAGPFIDNALAAERQGYDVFVIGTYIEPFLREIRAAVDIPVVSSFETMLLVGCSVGRDLGLVTLNSGLRWILQTNLEAHRLGSRIVSLASVEPELTEQELNRLLTAPGDYVDRFRQAAQAAVRAGADVIVPAEGLLAEIVSAAGLREIDGASVLDGIGIPVAYAEMMAKLRMRSGLLTGRGLHYARPPEAMLAFLAERRAHQSKDAL